ncbi:MAG: peptide chain release factor N(5)-glutamine methyltransferase [Cyclobacteriaceae bacterium]|nr:peptide chain release factor N(5)-glutamine methyltransferase [Cyclobacteriaceae bacterium]
MINSKDLFRDLRKRITLVQEASETESILHRVLEEVSGITRSDIISQKAVSLTAQEISALDSIIDRINTSEPVQYILGKADFFGREFLVNTSVLIPRPETELLVEEVLTHASNTSGKILDIGTGSGCIAVTLSRELPKADVYAFDISEEALQTARSNAARLNANVTFQQVDILKDEITLRDLDCIVSNPPYVAVSERDSMHDNVLNYEPHLALFVPDNDPLIFYKIIATKGKEALKSGGRLVVEINERFGKEVCAVFAGAGFSDVRIIKDLQNKNRIVSAVK